MVVVGTVVTLAVVYTVVMTVVTVDTATVVTGVPGQVLGLYVLTLLWAATYRGL